MNNYSLSDVYSSNDRYKLYLLETNSDKLIENISFFQKNSLSIINVGKELSKFIAELDDIRYLNIDVYEFTKNLLTSSKIDMVKNEIVVIYNIGILLEPKLNINSTQLIKEISKTKAVIILWENQSESIDQLNWPTQIYDYSFNFSDIQLKKLQNVL